MKRRLLLFLLTGLMLVCAYWAPEPEPPAMGVVHQHLVSPADQKGLTGFRPDGSLVSHLPILILHTDGRIIPGRSREDAAELSCRYSIIDGPEGLNRSSGLPDLEGSSLVAVRGNSSRDYPKAQYIFKTVDSTGSPQDVPLLGMPAESVWVLSGSYIDHSQLRNYMLYNLSGEIMAYAPRCRLCEVFTTDLRGRPVYQGTYSLIEKIKVADVRLPLEDVRPGYREVPFLAQMNSIIDNTRLTHLKPDGMFLYSFDLLYPEPEVLTQESADYLQRELLIFEKAMNDAVYTGDWEAFNSMLDMDTFIDYYLINEFFLNLDAGTRSTYLSRDLGGRYRIGPVWDFDGAMDNYQDTAVPVNALHVKNSFYFWALFHDPLFVEQVQQRYLQLRQGVLSEEALLTFLHESSAYLEGPALRNCRRWYDDDGAMFFEDVADMEEFIRRRGRWMDENFRKACITIK